MFDCFDIDEKHIVLFPLYEMLHPVEFDGCLSEGAIDGLGIRSVIDQGPIS